MQGADRSSADPFRPDLEGLRGIAILLVLAFHAGLPWSSGGFVGVDVFFVLSGFLITGLLVRERERTGRIELRAFYARRARRILPAAAVVLLATLALSWALLSPLDLIRVSDDALASALSAGNVRFAAEATDYFSAGVTPSPFLHYWSLGVEEQFYLLWPALLILALALPRPRLSAGLVLAGVLLSSYGLALYLTDASPAWAFYALPSRAWQLALGGLLAVLAARRARGAGPPEPEPEPADVFAEGPDPPVPGPAGPAPVPARRLVPELLVAALGWAGLGAIAASLVLIDPGTPYPGLAALAPSLGAAALIATGERPFSPGALLVAAPLRFLGRISYSLYLVHWPILVLPAAGLALGDELPIEERLGLAAASVVVAFLCYRLVELPVHRGLRFAMRPGRTLALAGATIAATAVIAVGVGTVMSRDLDSSLSAAETATPDGGSPSAGAGAEAALGPGATGAVGQPGDTGPAAASSAEPSIGNDPGPAASNGVAGASSAGPGGLEGGSGSTGNPPSGAPATTPGGTAVGTPKPTAKPTPAPTLPPLRHPSGRQPLPANVRPSLVQAANDWEQIERDGCTLSERAIQPTDCVYGDPKGTYTVALVGDSHAAQWFPAVEKIAVDHGWKLIPYTKLACRFVDLPIYSRTLKREFTECETWRKLVVQQLQALKPDLVLVSSAEGMAPMVAADDNPTRQGVAMARLLAQIPGRIGVIVDTPWSIYDVPSCISRHLNDVTPCETTRAAAYTWRYLKLETAATKASGATLIDLSAAICPWDPCPVVLNGMIVYRDAFHLTATFAESLAPALEAALPKPQAIIQGPAALASPSSAGRTALRAAGDIAPGPGWG